MSAVLPDNGASISLELQALARAKQQALDAGLTRSMQKQPPLAEPQLFKGITGSTLSSSATSTLTLSTDGMLPLTPVQRLVLSREKLRVAMLPSQPIETAKSGFLDRWLTTLKKVPGVGLLVDVAHGWWYRHPLKPVSDAAGQASKAAIKPFAQRHPMLLVMLAAAAGVAVASLRPWRFALRSALFAGYLPRILSRLITRLPVESWLSMLNNFTSTRSRPQMSQPAAPQFSAFDAASRTDPSRPSEGQSTTAH